MESANKEFEMTLNKLGISSNNAGEKLNKLLLKVSEITKNNITTVAGLYFNLKALDCRNMTNAELIDKFGIENASTIKLIIKLL
ncbi:MAG: hypothetical protein CVU09_00240 [Bacteroidetes bacterium HGW-Bacteroidetes-4]|jgi:hypothetical protein|nr:MAG: hypothetical protein CVU09_00240 [Bacteroidetes bacterium HGW-Bacteroidetes-4]